MTTFFLTLVTDLPTIHSSNFGARPVALPSWSGDGVYIHYWTHFYELNCSSGQCSWVDIMYVEKPSQRVTSFQAYQTTNRQTHQ